MQATIRQAILAAVVWGVAVSAPAAGGGEYRPVSASHRLFDDASLGLMDMEREKLANGLAAYVANRFAEGSPGGSGKGGAGAAADLDLASRMLAVALQLQPRNRTALVANFKLQRGMPTQRVETEYSPDLLAEFFYVRSRLLIEQGGPQNELLASYLLALSVELDPMNEDAIYDLELRRVDKKPIEWELLFPAEAKGGAGEEKKPAQDKAPVKAQPKPKPKPAAPAKSAPKDAGKGDAQGKGRK